MRLFLFCVLFSPAIFLVYKMLYLQTANDPIKYIYTFTGVSAIVLLLFSTTISLIKKKINLLRYRRQIGLFGFFYAFLHILNFIVLDAQLDFGFVLNESLDKPFVYLGMLAFLMLLFMAITSFKKWFAYFYLYHRVIYIALFFVIIHFVMAQKALNMAQYGYLSIIVIIVIFKIKQRVNFKILPYSNKL